MKILALLASFLIFSCNSTHKKYDSGNLPEFPAYAASMLKDKVSCGAFSIFGNCYAECENQKNCDCEGSYFSCNCSCIENDGRAIQKPTTVMSVSVTQYENWKKFSEKLREMNSPRSLDCYIILVEMFQCLKDSDSFTYIEKSGDFIRSLKKLTSSEKQSLNDFLKKLSENSLQIP